jgi:hypothetical protein
MLPPNEPVEDPRHFYASDSPVCEDYNLDSDVYKSAEDLGELIETEDPVENVASGSNTRPNVRLFVCLGPSPLIR